MLIMETSVNNPIISGGKHFNDGTSVVEINLKNVNKYFDCVYVLVKKTDEHVPIKYYLKNITKDDLVEMQKKLIIWKVPMDILKNEKHFDRVTIVSKETVEPFNEFNFSLSDNILLLSILNISFKNILTYLNSIEGSTLEKIYNHVLMNNYFDDKSSNIKTQKKLEQLIQNMEESNYWTMPYNCLANLSKSFKYRRFHSNFKNKMKEKNLDEDKRDDYLDMIFKTSKYVDAASVLQKNGYKLYNVSSKCNYTKDEITELFKSLDDTNRNYLFANMMVSKKYCHLVVNNKEILEMMATEMKDNAILYRYLMGYSWLRFYFEESIKKRNLTIEDDVIFDIDTASKLPVFPFSMHQPKINPYMPIMVDDAILKPEKNVGAVKDFKSKENVKHFTNQGICSLNEFKRRMNLFISNNGDNDIFNDVEWKKWKVAISGSIMSACIQKNHKLLDMFTEKNMDDKLIRYFNEYYASADIDVMFSHENIFDYLEAVTNFYNQILVNTCIIYSPYAEPEHIKLQQQYQLHFCVNEDWVKKHITNENITFDFVFKNVDEKDVQSMFVPFIEESYKKYLENQFKDFEKEEVDTIKCKFPDYFQKLSEYQIKIHIYLNKESDSPREVKNGEVKINYKHRIVSPHFNHPMEIFKISSNDHIGAVSQFHLPCVRAFYNGDSVYMTPTCVSAHLTYMNIDYKYFSGMKDPIEIINKNRMRGFGTWLNDGEIKEFVKYSTDVSFWSNLYGNNNSAESNAKNLGYLPLSHKLFHPRLINIDEYYDAPPVNIDNGYNDSYDGEEVKTKDDMINEYLFYSNKKSNKPEVVDNVSTMFNISSMFTTIGPDGSIQPLQKWVIDASFKLKNMVGIKNTSVKSPLNTDSDSDMPPLVQMNNNLLPSPIIPVPMNENEIFDDEDNIDDDDSIADDL